MRLTGTKALVSCLVRDQPTSRTAARSSGESARAATSCGSGVEPLDLGGELARHVGQFAERARDRAQSDSFERLAELGDGCVEALPQLERARGGTARRGAARGRAACCARRGADDARGRAGRRGAGRRPPARRRWRSRARAGRSRSPAAPRRWPRARRPSAGRRAAPVRAPRGDRRSWLRSSSSASGPTVMMWSAICLGAAVREGSVCAALGGEALPGGRMPVRRRTAARGRPQSDAPATCGPRGRPRGART